MTVPRPLDRGALAAHPLPPVIDGEKESRGRVLVIAALARKVGPIGFLAREIGDEVPALVPR